MSEYDRPWDLANAVLAAVQAEYVIAVGLDPTNQAVPLPPLQFVSNGDIPADTELLAVAMTRMYGVSLTAGIPSEEVAAERCLHWRAATFEVVLLRCSPVLEDHPYEGQPDVDYNIVEQSARQVMRDAMIITRGIRRAYDVDAFGIGPTLAFENWDALPAEGGFVGGSLKVRIGLLG